MSFSIDIKDEISRIDYNKNEKKAMLSALIKINGTLNMTSKGHILDIRTENAKTAKLIFLIIQELFLQDARLLVSKKVKLKKNNVYVVQVRSNALKIISELEVYKNGLVDVNPTKKILKNDKILQTYLGGCFLASGSINNPISKNYHLEISLNSEKSAIFISKIISKFGLNPKIIKRRNSYIVYLKKSEEISDFLRIIRAQNALLFFEDQRISKDYWNSNNRLIICEVSNEVKTLENASKQVEQIRKILNHNKEYLLDQKDKLIADIRMENQEASLQELAQIFISKTGKVISKSGINHRLRKISEIASQLKGE